MDELGHQSASLRTWRSRGDLLVSCRSSRRPVGFDLVAGDDLVVQRTVRRRWSQPRSASMMRSSNTALVRATDEPVFAVVLQAPQLLAVLGLAEVDGEVLVALPATGSPW
jgi:hypothetical protein